jgi:hypothetical protein
VGYAVSSEQYATVFGAIVLRPTSPSAFVPRRGALSRAASAASPISFAADTAAAAALTPTAPP